MAFKVTKSKAKFYAVHKGHHTGIFDTWSECELHVKGFAGAIYKAFPTRMEAETFVRYGLGSGGAIPAPAPGPAPVTPVPSSSKAAGKRPASAMQAEAQSDAEWDAVYTDGACSGNGKVGSIAGVGVWYGVNDERNLSERCPGDQTNNRAELIAIARVLEEHPYKRDRPLKILTDSKYSIQCFRDWLPGWRKRGWIKADGKPVLNVGIIKYIDALLELRSKLGHKIRMEHVRGHQGIEGNEGADKLAVAGCRYPAQGERNWDALEDGVRAKIATADARIAEKAASRAPVEVAEATPEPRAKFQRVDSSGERRSSGVASAQHLWQIQPPETPARKAVISPEEINPADYEGCFEDDEQQLLEEVNSPDPPRTAGRVSAAEITSADLEAFASGLLDDDDLAAELSD